MNLSDLFGSMFGQGTQQPAATLSDPSTGMPAPLGTDPNTGMPSSEHPYIPPDPSSGSATKTSSTGTDRLKNLAAQLQMANSIASLGRGMYSDLSRGPGGSPIAAARTPQTAAFQPTAYGAGGMRLSDLLSRRMA